MSSHRGSISGIVPSNVVMNEWCFSPCSTTHYHHQSLKIFKLLKILRQTELAQLTQLLEHEQGKAIMAASQTVAACFEAIIGQALGLFD